MSTSMYAATLLVDPSMKAQVFETAEDLMNAKALSLQPRAGLRTYGDSGTQRAAGLSTRPGGRRRS